MSADIQIIKTIGDLYLIEIPEKPVANGKFIHYKKNLSGIERNKSFNLIEITGENINLNFEDHLFVCNQFKLTDDINNEKYSDMQKVDTHLDIFTSEEGKWFKLNSDMNEIVKLMFNPFWVGMPHLGRLKTKNPYLPLLFLKNRTDFLQQDLLKKKLSSKFREINIYMQITLTKSDGLKFIDLIKLPFRSRSIDKLRPEKNVDEISEIKDTEAPEKNVDETSETKDTEILEIKDNEYLELEESEDESESGSENENRGKNIYELTKIFINKGNEGDIISLDGYFPPQGQFKIIFGIHKIDPLLWFQSRLQCLVPMGTPGKSVSVFIICDNGMITDSLTFTYNSKRK